MLGEAAFGYDIKLCLETALRLGPQLLSRRHRDLSLRKRTI